MPIDGETVKLNDSDPKRYRLPSDEGDLSKARAGIQGMLNNPDLRLKYENRRNGGMSPEEIYQIITKELHRTDAPYENTNARLYEVSYRLLTEMEKMILNSEDISGRAIDSLDKNMIINLRNKLRNEYNNIISDIEFLDTISDSDVEKMVEDIDYAEGFTLKYFQGLNAKSIAEDIINYYHLKNLCECNEYGRITFLQGSEGYNFINLSYVLFGEDITRSETYLESKDGKDTGVRSIQNINRKDERYIVNYNNADDETKTKVKNLLSQNSDECLLGTLYKDTNGDIIYTYTIENKNYNFNLTSDINKTLPIGQGVILQEEGGYYINNTLEVVKKYMIDKNDGKRDYNLDPESDEGVKTYLSTYEKEKVEVGVASKIPLELRMSRLFQGENQPENENQMRKYIETIKVPVYDEDAKNPERITLDRGKGEEEIPIVRVPLKVHKKLSAEVVDAFEELAYNKKIINSEKDRVSGYCWRSKIDKPEEMSIHSYGGAIDINPPVNGGIHRGDDPESKYFIKKDLVEIMKKHGFYWGGDWSKERKDPMHFSYTNE